MTCANFSLTYYIYDKDKDLRLPNNKHYYTYIIRQDKFHKKYFANNLWKERYGKHVLYSNYQDISFIKDSIPNINIMANKGKLYDSIDGLWYALPHINFNITNKEQMNKIFDLDKDDSLWFLKKDSDLSYGGYDVYPILLNQEFYKTLTSYIEESNRYKKYQSANFTIQKGVNNPLLINGRKFDLRIFCLVVFTNGNIGFYLFKKGLLRKSLKRYDSNTIDKATHITNTTFTYSKTTTSIDGNSKFTELFDKKHKYYNYYDKIKDITNDICNIYKNKLDISTHKYGYILLGFDYIIDINGNVYILEINDQPQLHYDKENIDNKHKGLEYDMFADFYKLTFDAILTCNLVTFDTDYYDFLLRN